MCTGYTFKKKKMKYCQIYFGEHKITGLRWRWKLTQNYLKYCENIIKRGKWLSTNQNLREKSYSKFKSDTGKGKHSKFKSGKFESWYPILW